MMRHKLCKEFYEYWTSCCWGHNLPDISNFSDEIMTGFQGYGVILACRQNDIFIDYVGTNSNHIIPMQMKGACLTDLVAPALKAMQMALLMPCFSARIGMSRFSRYSYVTHTMDVEMLLLPVRVADTGLTALVGLCVSTLLPKVDSVPEENKTATEQVLLQNYLSLGRSVDLTVIDGHTWAVLDTMGAVVTVDGKKVEDEDGENTDQMVDSKSQPSKTKVLAVAKKADHSAIAARLGKRYDVTIVSTLSDARRILINEMVDILVAAETCDDCSGLDLLGVAQTLSAFTTCVFMLNPRWDGKQTLVKDKGVYVECLPEPFASNALADAIESARSHTVHVTGLNKN